MTAAPSTHTDLKSTLEEMRASAAARGARAGLAGAIEEAFLRILSLLLAMLEDFRAGRLAPIAPAASPADGGADGTVADPSPGMQRGSGVANGAARTASWRVGIGGVHAPAITAEGAAAGDVALAAEDIAPAVDPSPSIPTEAPCAPCRAGPMQRRGTGVTVARRRASPRPPRFATIARLIPRAAWRTAHGLRRALPCRRKMAGEAGQFFKNAAPGERIGTGRSFQDKNDTTAAGVCSIFS